MLFNSIDFAIFLPIVYILYWYAAGKSIRVQNILLIAASYLFYGFWDWKFLSLIIVSSFIDYYIGLSLAKTAGPKKRKLLLALSICVNLGLLGFFKYCNFFADSFAQAFTFLGFPIEASRLNIILPVGISFYTFQTLSYSIDVYRKKLEPTRDMAAFFAFVSFFPQLVAGPIERAVHLLPQFSTKRLQDYETSVRGLYQILWGLFKKIVIADRLAVFVDVVYSNPGEFNGFQLLIATLFFAVQIYCDFSGYSLIAVGTAKLFGFSLMKNFNTPYFALSLKEFWGRWHISLSTWFRDYLYIPLGGSKEGRIKWMRNILVTFLLSGLWHGPSWTFVIWGGLHGCALIIEHYLTELVKKLKIGSFKIVNTAAVCTFVCLTWIFFRARTVSGAWLIVQKITALPAKALHFNIHMLKEAFQSLVIDGGLGQKGLALSFVLIGGLFLIEYYNNRQSIPGLLRKSRPVVRWTLYLAVIVGTILLSVDENTKQFIYFQF